MRAVLNTTILGATLLLAAPVFGQGYVQGIPDDTADRQEETATGQAPAEEPGEQPPAEATRAPAPAEAPGERAAEIDAVQTAVARRIAENLQANDGTFVLENEPGLMLYLDYIEEPEPADARGVWHVAAEFRTLQQAPDRFPTIEEAGATPTEVARTPQEVDRRFRETRDPLSYELTFQVERRGDAYEVTDYWISALPPGAPEEVPVG